MRDAPTPAHRAQIAVPTGNARVGPFMCLPDVLRELGADPVALLATEGISPDDFADPENVVPFALFGRLLRRCVEATGCPHLALLVGRRATVSSLGVLGFLMKSSPTVREALGEAATHLHAQDRGAALTLDVDGRFATLAYRILVPVPDGADEIYRMVAAIMNNMLRSLCGHAWRAHEVQLCVRRPASVIAYRQAFEAPVRFDADRTAIVFDAVALAQPLPSADPFLRRMMAERVREMAVHERDDLVDRSRRLLAALIFLPACSPTVLASRLELSLRTMNRRLAEHGTSFQQLRDAACRDAAFELLAQTGKPVNEIAAALGYSHPSAFTHAFQRWAGTSPAAWRAARHPRSRSTVG